MTRPVYETKEDREREAAVLKYVTKRLGLSAKGTAQFCNFDAHLFSEEGQKAIVEIKCRNNPSNFYPTYMTSKRKCDDGMRDARRHLVPFFLVINWTDCTKMTRVRTGYKQGMGGREDRGDPQDKEICYFIPMEEFKEIAPPAETPKVFFLTSDRQVNSSQLLMAIGKEPLAGYDQAQKRYEARIKLAQEEFARTGKILTVAEFKKKFGKR